MISHYADVRILNALDKLICQETMNGNLMNCLEAVCRLHDLNLSRSSLLAGLPLANGELSQSALSTAASRAGLKSELLHRSVDELENTVLPAILILNHRQSCVLVSLDRENWTAEVIRPELDAKIHKIDIKNLRKIYSEYLIYIRPQWLSALDFNEAYLPKPARDDLWGALRESIGL